jgi:hypothetical protein
MKRQIFTLVFAVVSLISLAQDNTNARLHPLTKLDLGLQGVGLTFERRLGNEASIDLAAGLGGGYDIWSHSFTYIAQVLSPSGYVSITPKLFYNRSKRIAKGRSVELNGGDYIGLRIKYTTRGIAESSDAWDALLFNIHWGLQRAIAKRWTVNTHLGIGYAINAVDLNHAPGSFYPSVGFNFSYILNKPRTGRK